MFLVGQHDRPDAHGPLDELKALSSPLRVTEERAEQPAERVLGDKSEQLLVKLERCGKLCHEIVHQIQKLQKYGAQLVVLLHVPVRGSTAAHVSSHR